jgi:hypothetical protein
MVARCSPTHALTMDENLHNVQILVAGGHLNCYPGDYQHQENPHAGVCIRTRRVTNWQNGSMAPRWITSTFPRTEKNFRRILGYRELWTLEAILSESQFATQQAVA